MTDLVFDYVIVGAGSAGCALAARLSEDQRCSIAVLETGGSDAGPLIQMPAAFSIPMNTSAYDWRYQSEMEPNLNNRRLAVPRGKVIGGSSSINGMVFVRGHSKDFDAWADAGAIGWSYRHVLPYFRRMETAHGGTGTGPTYPNPPQPFSPHVVPDEEWRGLDGPLHVTRGRLENPLYQAFIRAGLQSGYPVTDDYNGQFQEGFGALEMTVWRGRRWSAANAYLKPALSRKNLTLLSRTFVESVQISDGRAVGVRAKRSGKEITVGANREVILCASAINSPKILMQSGIGDAQHLSNHGVPVIAHRPGVGENLQDHLEIYVQQSSTQPISLYSQLGLFARARIGLQWLLTRSGLGATNHFEAGAFIRSAEAQDYPDFQLHFLPAAIRYDGKAAAQSHGYQIHIGPMRSPSRGHVRLRSSNPSSPPIIRFNYMDTEQDWQDFRRAIRLARTIFAQDAFSPFRGREISPGDAVQTDEEIDDFVRDHVESAYHPCGTCRMGAPNDPLSVVDPECRVIGVQDLRVVDSSIFPLITNGNLNAPSIMVGEKAADLILGKSSPAERATVEEMRPTQSALERANA